MAKKTKTLVGIKVAKETPVPKIRETPPGKPPKQIRMLVSLADSTRAFTMGCVYRVPHDVKVPTARSWISSGVAVEVESE